jgi:hypothetical protein
MKKVMLSLVLMALSAVVGVGQVPLQPGANALASEPILSLDLSQATFSQPPGVPEGTGAWLIPVKGLSGILNAPPSQATAIGVIAAGPMLAVAYFRVARGMAYLEISGDCWTKVKPATVLISEHWKKEKVYSASNGYAYSGIGVAVAGELRLDLVYPGLPTLAERPWWWPKSVTLVHTPGCTWSVTLQW